MSDLVVTVAVTYPDGTIAMWQASATVTGPSPSPLPPPAPAEEPAFIRQSRITGMGYR